ncbi:hypothetical protein GE09DRAFT_529584 [Coniochaeta sp. 2T2.1]|nr:hypothetical protein GE09DRAFT_529584 [Coniochaeta sp. 2T2.1]
MSATGDNNPERTGNPGDNPVVDLAAASGGQGNNSFARELTTASLAVLSLLNVPDFENPAGLAVNNTADNNQDVAEQSSAPENVAVAGSNNDNDNDSLVEGSYDDDHDNVMDEDDAMDGVDVPDHGQAAMQEDPALGSPGARHQETRFFGPSLDVLTQSFAPSAVENGFGSSGVSSAAAAPGFVPGSNAQANPVADGTSLATTL